MEINKKNRNYKYEYTTQIAFPIPIATNKSTHVYFLYAEQMAFEIYLVKQTTEN